MKILDDYRHEIVGNRRTIDIHKDGVVNIDFNIDFNNRGEDNNSNCNLNRDYNCNRKASIISNFIRKTSIISIIKIKRERNNKIVDYYERGYAKNGIYNCERGATTDDPRLVDGEVNPPPSSYNRNSCSFLARCSCYNIKSSD